MSSLSEVDRMLADPGLGDVAKEAKEVALNAQLGSG